MAHVTQDASTQARIDRFLTYLLRAWRSVPVSADEFETWDPDQQLDFVLEWPIKEDRLARLQDAAEQDRLTPAQRIRYDELQRLVARHRPTIDRLLQG